MEEGDRLSGKKESVGNDDERGVDVVLCDLGSDN